MATDPTVAGGSGPRTIVAEVDGTDEATYQLPPGLAQYVQAVYVELDNGAAVAIRPTLLLEEQSGVVIATKRPGEAIPAGDTGSVTWALRLDDDTPAAPSGSGIQFDTDNQGGWLDVTTNDTDPDGLGMQLRDRSGGGIIVDATVPAGLGPDIALKTNRDGNILLSTDDDGDIEIGTGGDLIRLVGGIVQTNATIQVRMFLLAVGINFTVFDHNGDPIFRVNEDGSLQGKTGKALTFNL